ncbi:MAG: hypothetical protein IJK81_11280 [Selenomonadaceae bacterium]|nr:hypothetical protein [Selenomonadaceae bacterium]
MKGGFWIYQVSYKAPDGSAKRKKFAVKTKHEAMEKGKTFLMANQQGSIFLKADMTVVTWIDEWMENYVKPRIRPRIFQFTFGEWTSRRKCSIVFHSTSGKKIFRYMRGRCHSRRACIEKCGALNKISKVDAQGNCRVDAR